MDIRVNIEQSTKFGELHPKFDKESGILEVSSIDRKEWKYGIDIDGSIIFDIDKDQILENFDILISRKLWGKINKPISITPIKKGNLRINTSSLNMKSFNYPELKILSAPNNQILIQFHNFDLSDLSAIKISSKCYALLKGDILKGFYIWL